MSGCIVICPISEEPMIFTSLTEAYKFCQDFENHPSSKLEEYRIFHSFVSEKDYEIFCGTIEETLVEVRKYLELGVGVRAQLGTVWSTERKRYVPSNFYTIEAKVLVPRYEYCEDFYQSALDEEAYKKEIRMMRR